MESTLSHVISPSERALGDETASTPFAPQTGGVTKQADSELQWQAHYWRAQYEPRMEREAALQAESEAYQATIRDLTQRLYGTQSEKATRLKTAGDPRAARPRQRGQPPGRPGHGRRACSTLPVLAAVRALGPTEQRCSRCGAAFRPFPGPAASTIIAGQVQAHGRRIHRQRYHKGCRCPHLPGIVAAPPAPRLLPKSPFGVSGWTAVVLDKYRYGRPTARLCQAFQHQGGPLAHGTVPDG